MLSHGTGGVGLRGGEWSKGSQCEPEGHAACSFVSQSSALDPGFSHFLPASRKVRRCNLVALGRAQCQSFQFLMHLPETKSVIYKGNTSFL